MVIVNQHLPIELLFRIAIYAVDRPMEICVTGDRLILIFTKVRRQWTGQLNVFPATVLLAWVFSHCKTVSGCPNVSSISSTIVPAPNSIHLAC